MRRMLVGLLVSSLLAVSCGSSQRDHVTRLASNGIPRSAVNNAATVDLSALPTDLSVYQRQLVADGLLTADEYQEAALEVVRCHKEHGATIRGQPHYAGEEGVPDPWWSPRGQYMYSAGYPKDDMYAPRDYAACETTYFNFINATWTNFIAPTVAEMQEARDIVAKCLREQGIDVPEHPSTQELAPITVPRRTDPKVLPCLRAGADHIGMPSFVA